MLFLTTGALSWLGVPTQFPWWMKATLLCILLIFLLRALIVFPWEKKKIKQIEKYLDNCEYSLADKSLKQPHIFYGMPAKIKLIKLKIRRSIQKEDIFNEYMEVHELKRLALLQSEKRNATLREATVLYRAGDYRDFKTVLSGITKETLATPDEKWLYAQLLGFQFAQEGNYAAAKSVLENAIAESLHESQEKQLVPYLNLAVFETLSGNFNEAESSFLKAMDILREHPQPYLFEDVFHNLIQAKIKNGKIGEAVALLNEYRTCVDRNNPYQLMGLSNEWLMLARQTEILNFLYLSYAIMDAEIKPRLSNEEWLAEFVSEIHSMTNDPVDNSINFYKADLLFTELIEMGFPKNFYALKELYFSLSSLPLDRLKEFDILLNKTITALLDLRSRVEEYLKDIPRQLLDIRFSWLSDLSFLHKIVPMHPEDYNRSFFETLFINLDELARQAKDKENPTLQIRALILICDDYVNYSLSLNEDFRSQFKARAHEALNQASLLTEQRIADPAVEEFLIGLAWFELHINGDKVNAAHWIGMFEKRGTNIHHYALWMQKYYSEVKQALPSIA